MIFLQSYKYGRKLASCLTPTAVSKKILVEFRFGFVTRIRNTWVWSCKTASVNALPFKIALQRKYVVSSSKFLGVFWSIIFASVPTEIIAALQRFFSILTCFDLIWLAEHYHQYTLIYWHQIIWLQKIWHQIDIRFYFKLVKSWSSCHEIYGIFGFSEPTYFRNFFPPLNVQDFRRSWQSEKDSKDWNNTSLILWHIYFLKFQKTEFSKSIHDFFQLDVFFCNLSGIEDGQVSQNMNVVASETAKYQTKMHLSFVIVQFYMKLPKWWKKHWVFCKITWSFKGKRLGNFCELEFLYSF